MKSFKGYKIADMDLIIFSTELIWGFKMKDDYDHLKTIHNVVENMNTFEWRDVKKTYVLVFGSIIIFPEEASRIISERKGIIYESTEYY